MTRKSPVAGKRWRDLSLKVRFKASYKVDAASGCWNWVRAGAQGYGGITVNGKETAAHRASWMLLRGEIPPSVCVLHKCDNRSCVNPRHLYLGDKKQNRRDFMLRHPRAKELLDALRKQAGNGPKRFWQSLTKRQRVDFCRRRSLAQAAKRRAS